MRKYIKLLAFLCLPLAFTACDDDENLNGGEATVQFQSASLTVSETATSLDLPIVVTGEHDGLIKVRVEYTEAHGLKDDVNVIITSRDLLIPAGTEQVVVETRLSVANEEVENGRVLAFEIVDVQGATLGTNATCNVKLKESAPYEGTFYITGMDAFTGSIGSMPCQLLLSETVADQLELNLGYGATVPVTMVAAEKEGDYELYFQGDNYAGDYSGFDLTFCYAIAQGIGSVAHNTQEIAGYFDGETQTITIYPIQSMTGVGLLAPAGGWLNAYVAYPGEGGEIVPVQMIKQ